MEGCYGFIFARGGSKGVPRKNVKNLGGKPLIAWSIQSALDSPSIEKVFVSTDNDEIADIALDYGAEVPFMRPKELAGDLSPEWLAWKHAVKEIQKIDDNFKLFITLPPTSPFRSVYDIENCIEEYKKGDVDMVITTTESNRNPWFNMIKIDGKGYARRVLEPQSPIFRRQDAPMVYDMTTVAYVTSPEFILSSSNLFDGDLRVINVPKVRAIDIDTEFDFLHAEFLLQHKMI